MQQVKNGDTVKVHYHGKLTDGTTFDSSEGRQPLEFEVGSGSVIPGFDSGVVGMSVGDKKTINIPADEAYGERAVGYEDMRRRVPDASKLYAFTGFRPRISLDQTLREVIDHELSVMSGAAVS